MNSAGTIAASVSSKMAERGWPLRSICGLPAAYCREAPVTPYFVHSGSQKRPFGAFAIYGALGLIHKEFEAHWARSASRDRHQQEGFGLLLNIANVELLRRSSYIPMEGPYEDHVGAFCSAAVAVLEKLPQSEAELIQAFATNNLGGFPLDSYAGHVWHTKFQAFKRFMRE